MLARADDHLTDPALWIRHDQKLAGLAFKGVDIGPASRRLVQSAARSHETHRDRGCDVFFGDQSGMKCGHGGEPFRPLTKI